MENLRKKILYLETEKDEYGCIEAQTVYDGNDELFNVYNLSECPEDATISRDLFSASQYLEAVRYGMDLAKQGYTEVEYERD